MTNEEFSNEFDTLINSNSVLEPFGLSQSPFSFDEYEKSIYLTKAQEEVVEGLYVGKISGEPFENTEQLRRYLSDLVRTESIPCNKDTKGLSSYSVFATLPENLWFITYESVTLESDTQCMDGKSV